MLFRSQEVFLGRDYQTQHSYSENVAAAIDAEVKRIVDESHAQAVKILKEHRAVLDNMARVLIECETIYSEEVEMLMNGASPEEVKAELNARLDYKAAHKGEIEKAPAKKLSDFAPVAPSETPSAIETPSVADTNSTPTVGIADTPEQPEDKGEKATHSTKKPIKRSKPKSDGDGNGDGDKTDE